MFDSPFDFFSLVIAIVALIFARKAFNQAAMLRARLDALEASALSAVASKPVPPRCKRVTSMACSWRPRVSNPSKSRP